MFLRILKKDLKRKKTMNVINLLFVILAAMFVASGLNNVITVANGTDYYLNKAGVGDYNVLINNASDYGLETILDNTKEVDSYHVEETVWAQQGTMHNAEGKVISSEGGKMNLIQAYTQCAIKFFDENNEIPKEPRKGHCYVTADFLNLNNMQPGDEIQIKMNDAEITVIADRNVKDAFLGSEFMGNGRILLNASDYETLSSNETIKNNGIGKICYINTNELRKVEAATSSVDGQLFAIGRSTIKLTYVMSMIVAFITLILSVCLMIVSFAILKFTITLTITEEYREIGVMKAIGIRNFKIRVLYLVKYLLFAIVGSAAGFVLSIPFGNLLIRSASDKMVLGNDLGIWTNFAGSVLVVIVIMLFAYKSTGLVKKATPIDAIRSGQTGERYTKKSVLKLSKSKLGTPLFMAVNDVLSSFKRYLTITIAFTLCTLFVLVLVNTVSTMKSDKLVTTFASRSDLYFVAPLMPYMHEGGEVERDAYIQKVEDDLAKMGMPGEVFVDVQYAYPLECKGEEYSIRLQQGVKTTTDMYQYSKGTVPENVNEIAITPIVAEKMNAHIGDIVTIDYGTEKIDCVITAYFESMNMVGEIIRIHEDAPTSMANAASAMAFQINFNDHPSAKQIEERKVKLAEYLDSEEVYTAKEYQMDCLGVIDTMELVQMLLLAITLVVVVLVTILMERSFISDERSEIAILKAMGFKNRRVILYHVLRFGLVTVCSVLLAGILSIPVTKLCISPVFGLMGTSNVDFLIEPLKVFLIYPGIVLSISIITIYITALYTRTIKCSDTASIE